MTVGGPMAESREPVGFGTQWKLRSLLTQLSIEQS